MIEKLDWILEPINKEQPLRTNLYIEDGVFYNFNGINLSGSVIVINSSLKKIGINGFGFIGDVELLFEKENKSFTYSIINFKTKEKIGFVSLGRFTLYGITFNCNKAEAIFSKNNFAISSLEIYQVYSKILAKAYRGKNDNSIKALFTEDKVEGSIDILEPVSKEFIITSFFLLHLESIKRDL